MYIHIYRYMSGIPRKSTTKTNRLLCSLLWNTILYGWLRIDKKKKKIHPR